MARFRVGNTPALELSGWTTIDVSAGSPNASTEATRMMAERAVAEVLQCDHVMALTGLGTSLCITNPNNAAESLFPTMGDLWNKVSSAVGADSFERVKAAVGMGPNNNIEDLLSRCQMKLSLEPHATVLSPTATTQASVPSDSNVKVFVEKAEAVIRSECRKPLATGATGVHEAFLLRFLQRGPRRPRPNLFTTNYDLCFELAAARIGLPVIDGFAFTIPPRFQPEVFDYDIVTTSSYSKEPDFVPRLLRLFKLHGSVDWHPDEMSIIKKSDTDTPVLIYPRSGKYAASYSPPFLEIMARFQGLLRQRSVGVLAVCTGFNDLHIVEPVLSAVKSNASLRMVVCAPDLCANQETTAGGTTAAPATPNEFHKQLDHLIEQGDARLTLINGTFPDLVRLMPMLPGSTDAEQHGVRIRKLEAEMARLKAGQKSIG